jgi:hypothetical protein
MLRLLAHVVDRLDRAAEVLLFDVLLSRRWRGKILAAALALTALWWLMPGGVRAPDATAAAAGLESSDAQLLIGRAWLDRELRDYRDRFTAYVFTKEDLEDGFRLGAHFAGTPVKYVTELMAYRVRGNQLLCWWPEDDSKTKTDIAVTREKNGRFDLKLVVASDPRHGGQSHTYYSNERGRRSDLPDLTAPLSLAVPLKPPAE